MINKREDADERSGSMGGRSASTSNMNTSAVDRPGPARCVLYCLFNTVVATGIVFANKAVFAWFDFKFVFALTLIHSAFTWIGMTILSQIGFFTPKKLPLWKLTPIAFGFVGYIVLCNVSLNVNSVGFYQVMKIAIAPTVVIMEFLMFRKLPEFCIILSVVVVCVGVGIATVTDKVVINNVYGMAIGVGATLVTAMYQIWVGSKQKELQANSSQLLLAYTPQAIVLLLFLTPIFEPMGWDSFAPGTLLGYEYTPSALFAIFISAVLGVLVSLSTFLVIGATSSLTYNIVGHVKTVLILSGGCVLFGDQMPWSRLAGIVLAMVGIIWYTKQSVSASMKSQAQVAIEEKNSSSSPLKQ